MYHLPFALDEALTPRMPAARITGGGRSKTLRPDHQIGDAGFVP